MRDFVVFLHQKLKRFWLFYVFAELITHQQQQQQQHHHHHEQQRFANPDDDEEPSVVPQKAPSGIIGADAGGVAVLGLLFDHLLYRMICQHN